MNMDIGINPLTNATQITFFDVEGTLVRLVSNDDGREPLIGVRGEIDVLCNDLAPYQEIYLSQEHVAALLPLLTDFVKTGRMEGIV